MRKPKLRELAEAIRAVVHGPFTAKFPKAPSVPPPDVRYKIEFNEEKCIFCGACVQVCPANARAIIDVPEMGIRRNIHYQDACVYCGQCVRYCTVRPSNSGALESSSFGAIYHTPVYDMAQTPPANFVNEIQSELVFCEDCGGVVGPKKQLLWIAHKVGSLVSANPNLYLTMYKDLGLIETTAQLSQYPIQNPKSKIQNTSSPFRSDNVRILCPSCRRKVYLRETWGE